MPRHMSRHSPDLLRPPAVPELGSAWACVLHDRGRGSCNRCSSPTTSSCTGWSGWGQAEGALKAIGERWRLHTQGSCSIFPGEMLCVFCPGKPAHLRCIGYPLPIPASPRLQHHPMGSSPGTRCPSQNPALPTPPRPAPCLLLPRCGAHPSGMGNASS